MNIWEHMSPAVRYAAIVGVVVVIGLVAVNLIASAPSGDFTSTRGVGTAGR